PALVHAGGSGSQIVGGKPVPNGKYPFMAVLQVGVRGGGEALCGGTLIDPDSVLTAAHCVVDARSVTLAVGRTVITSRQGRVRRAVAAYVHPRYDGARDNRYDVAVLKLDRPVRGIKPIRLSTAAQNYLERPGRLLMVAGWGTTRENGSPSDRMRATIVPVVSDAVAKRDYAHEGPQARFFPTLMVAAGRRGRDACQGDSGGPLFKAGRDPVEVGIVSYGIGCARAHYPGVYTEVNSPGIRSFIVRAAAR
ncbi:MAG: serine protease, partial [Rubrobacteraceae bacterium]|nr:serine protease [Rubrobacteraceae bacterium]